MLVAEARYVPSLWETVRAVDGSLMTPVFAAPSMMLAWVLAAVVVPALSSATPQTLQNPSSMIPLQLGCPHFISVMLFFCEIYRCGWSGFGIILPGAGWRIPRGSGWPSRGWRAFGGRLRYWQSH